MRPITRRWPLVLLIVLLGAAATVGGIVLRGVSYTSGTTLQLPVAGTGFVSSDDIEYTDRLINTYKEIVEGDRLKGEVDTLADPGEFELIFEPRPNTEFIDLVARAGDAAAAERAASAAAQVLLERVEDLSASAGSSTALEQQLKSIERRLVELRETQGEGTDIEAAAFEEEIRGLELRQQSLSEQLAALALAGEARSNLSVVESASTAKKDTYLSHWREVLLGLLCSCVLAGGTAILLERRRPQVDTSRELQEILGVPVTASIPVLAGSEAEFVQRGLITDLEPFRELRTRLLSDRDLPRAKTLVITSVSNGDGRSRISLHLAAAMARSGRRTLLVDGDFYAPKLSALFDSSDKKGLSDVSEAGLSVLPNSWLVSTAVPVLSFLPAGTKGVAATELLAGERISAVLRKAQHDFDFTIIDSPPIRASAIIGSPAIDEVFLLVPFLPVDVFPVAEASRTLSNVEASFAGVIVNRHRDSAGDLLL